VQLLSVDRPPVRLFDISGNCNMDISRFRSCMCCGDRGKVERERSKCGAKAEGPPAGGQRPLNARVLSSYNPETTTTLAHLLNIYA